MFIQYVRQEKFRNFLSQLLRPAHWFQFADDETIATCEEYKIQVFLNVFTAWVTWVSLTIQVNKCYTFDVAKRKTLRFQKHHLDYICHSEFCYWFEIHADGTLDIMLLAKSKFGLNI